MVPRQCYTATGPSVASITSDSRIPSERIDDFEGSVAYRYDAPPQMHTGFLKLQGATGDFAFPMSGSFPDFENMSIPGLAVDEEAVEMQEELLGGHGEEHDGEDHEHGVEEETILIDLAQKRYGTQLQLNDLVPGADRRGAWLLGLHGL